MTAEDQQEASNLFRMLTDLEFGRGTSAEAMLTRFPREFADAVRAAVRRLLDTRKQARKRPRTSS
jgi:hypothetical protein